MYKAYRIDMYGQFDRFCPNKLQAEKRARQCEEDVQMLGVDPKDKTLGVKISIVELPERKGEVIDWLNKYYA